VEGNAKLASSDVVDEVERLKEEPGGDLAVGGAGLASELIERNLVDDYRLFVSPVVLGRGTPYFPALERPIELELIETRTFGGGIEYLRYVRA
jgi:dihydrofolate reductase